MIVLSGSMRKLIDTLRLPASTHVQSGMVWLPPAPKIISEAMPNTTRRDKPAMTDAMGPAFSPTVFSEQPVDQNPDHRENGNEPRQFDHDSPTTSKG